MLPIPQTYRGPAFVDLQVNGYAGFDFNSDPGAWTPEPFHRIRSAMRHRGVSAALPTFITDAPERILARARSYAAVVERDPDLRAAFPLLHIEGPFISREEGPRGAHPERHCATPDELPDFLDAIIEASGERVGILTLAPELPGALAFIERASSRGLCIGIGHTGAPPEILAAAVEAGAKLSTHLGNGSHQVLPRLDNYVQRQLADDRLTASFIADGHHVPFSTLKNFIRAKTPDRVVLVTDAMAAADAPPGRYRLGDGEVIVTSDLRVHRPGEWNLAGSALTLDRAVLHVATSCDVPFVEAWRMASTRPAALVGLPEPPHVEVEVTREGMWKMED
jgi:N-acetylglucosamine-6-phosphate deacetylase